MRAARDELAGGGDLMVAMGHLELAKRQFVTLHELLGQTMAETFRQWLLRSGIAQADAADLATKLVEYWPDWTVPNPNEAPDE